MSLTRLSFLVAGLLCLSQFFSACASTGGGKRPRASGAEGELERCLKLSTKKKHTKAVECLEVFKSRYPSAASSADADLLIAENYFLNKEYLVAAESFRAFLERYPNHPKSDYAYLRSGLSYLHETPKSIDRDLNYLDTATRNLEMVVRYYPNSPHYPMALREYQKARAKQAAKHFYVGKFYYRYGEYLASIPRFVDIVRNYEGLGFDEKSFYYLVTALAKTGQPDKAREVITVFESRHPQSAFLKKAKGMLKS